MPFNSRDLWLVLKAQDQTNRALNTFSRNVRNAGDQVRMAQLQAAKANAMGMIQQQRLNNAVSQAEIGHLRTQKATLANAIAQVQYAGVTGPVVDQLKRQAAAIDANIIANRRNVDTSNNIIAQQRVRLAGINAEIDRVNAYNQSLRDHEKNLAHVSARMQSVAQTATAMGFAMSAAGIATLIGLQRTIDVAVEYEKQVRLTATQVDGFKGNLEELAEVGRRVARAIAVPFTEIQPALFDIFSSMEVGVTDAEKLLTSFSKAAVAGQVSIQDVSRATIGLLNAFQRPVSDVNKLLDIQFQLIQEGVGTYEEWNQRIGLVTPSAVRAGQSIELMMAALATATRMGLSAARSGTSVARAFDAMSHPAAVKNIEALGVKMRDANGKLLPFNVSLRQLREVIMKMPEKNRLETILNIFKGAGGTIEARRFIQNILLGAGNLEMFDNILNEMNKSAGSLDNAYGLMSDSVAAKTQLLKNQWMLLKESMGKALIPVFSAVIGWLVNLMKQYDKLSPGTKRIITLAIAAAAAFAAIVGPLLLIVGAVAAFVAAFTIAGTAILVVIGALAGITLALGALTAAFVLAYKKSLEFRVLIGQIGQYFRLLVREVEPSAKKIAAAFRDNVIPALDKLWHLLMDKVLPQFTMFANMVVSKVMPKIGEAARIIKDVAGKAFEFIGWVIEHLIVPAIEKLVGWWQRNKETLEPLIPIIAQAVKWFLIIAAVITGVLVVALIGPLVGAVGAVIAVFAALVAAVIYVIKFVKMLWGWLKDFGSWIADVFVGIWNGIVAFFTMIWEGIVNVFNAAINGIKIVWQEFWGSTIGKFLQAVWELIVSIVRLGWALIQTAFQGAIDYLTQLWNYFWPAISAVVSKVWNDIKNVVVNAWNTISANVRANLNGIWNIITSIFNNIVSIAQSIWNAVYNAIADRITRSKNVISDAINSIKNFFSNAGSWLINAGREIVNGLISGITDRIHALTDKINELARKITDRLPGSPVKAGPLRVLNRGYAGGQIVRMLAAGINDNMDLLKTSMNTFGATTLDSTPTYIREPSPTATTEVNQTFNITTQEIDPRKHSAELGFQLVGTM